MADTSRRIIRVELRPNNRQASYLRGCCGLARVAYNWGLADRKRRYETGEGKARFTGHFEQCHDWIAYRDAEVPWACQYPASVVLNALKNLDAAFAHFRRRLKEGGQAPGFPRFKTRGHAGSFQIAGGAIRPVGDGSAIRVPLGQQARIPKRLAVIRTKERITIPEGAVWKTATILFTPTGRWYAAMLCEAPAEEPPGEQSARPLAVHPGITCFAMLGDDRGFERIDAPEWKAGDLACLKRADRQLARRQPGSKGREEARLRRAKLHERLTNQRADFIEVFTTRLVRRGRPLVIQEWDVRQMYQTAPVARRLVDRPFYEIRRQLEYKAKRAGVTLTVIDRSVPVTQRCSRCGHVREGDLKLRPGVPIYTCPACGMTMCREENACRNLLAASTASTAGTHAGGADPAPEENRLGEGLAMKPEGSTQS